MNRFRPGRYHFLALVVIVITATSLFILGRTLSRIEATLPLTSLHLERDFAAFLLDVSRLEAALRVAVAAPTPEHVEQIVFSLDLAVVRSRDNQSLYRNSGLPGLTAFHQTFDQAVSALDNGLGQTPPTAVRLRPHLEQVERLRISLQNLNDQVFQASMRQASAQQRHLGQLGQDLPVLLILFGGFAVGLVYFALRQQRSIQALGEQEAQLRESEASYRKAEQELRRSNAELEQFAYAISHDMRQPLRMIASYQQLLGKALRDKLDDDTREYLHFATDGAKRLDQMLVALLDYSRVGRKTAPLDWIASRETLDEALLFLKPALDEAHAQIRITGDWPRLHASRDELVRLFQNLIGNALKYREAGRAPVVDVVGSQGEGRWTVRISDNGIGINPSQIERLFQVFQRLQSRAKFEGAGVGLALCRKIVEHHGGRIHAESAGEGQGSAFVFELPITSPPPEGERAHTSLNQPPLPRPGPPPEGEGENPR